MIPAHHQREQLGLAAAAKHVSELALPFLIRPLQCAVLLHLFFLKVLKHVLLVAVPVPEVLLIVLKAPEFFGVIQELLSLLKGQATLSGTRTRIFLN